jgi:hypothetical protein
VPGFASTDRLATEDFRRLALILSARGTEIVRFSAGELVQAILAPVSVLTAKPPSPAAQVHLKGIPLKKPPERVLIVSGTPAVSKIDDLLALIAKQLPESAQPGWLGIPRSRAASQNAVMPEIQSLRGDKESAGTLFIRDGQHESAYFHLYPLRGHRATPGFEPVKAKIREPEGNLRAREQWFRRRSGGR